MPMLWSPYAEIRSGFVSPVRAVDNCLSKRKDGRQGAECGRRREGHASRQMIRSVNACLDQGRCNT
jgi:hypothetical protein